MPIPDFDHNHVLPPHLGDPREKADLSPYPCSIVEFCHKFSTSPERITILKKFITFRQRMTYFGIIHGFQWLDGSFTENIETSEKRPPNDLDLVTFYGNVDAAGQANIIQNFPEFVSARLSKDNYKLDHYPVDYLYSPDFTVESTRYWIQLFTHNRSSIWKGMLRLPLNTPFEDQDALNYLNSI